MEAAMMVQQMQMQEAQLELAKLEAEVQKLGSEAAVNVAKAQSTAAEPDIQIAELQGKIEMKMQELQLRRELADLTNEVRTNQQQTAAAARIAATAMQTGAKTSNAQ
jgi:TolA-binding protein